MKKVFAILALALTSLMYVGCTDYSDDIQDLQNQINTLSSDKIKSISDQMSSIQTSITTLTNTDTELQKFIDEVKTKLKALENADETISAQIAEYIKTLTPVLEGLQTNDVALQDQIKALKDYINKDAVDWANATFASLKEYKETAAIVADIQAKVEKLSSVTAPVSQEDLKNAIAASETSIQTWVHSLLKGYYTAEQADAKLATFKTELTDEVAKIYDQKTATLKNEVDQAYKAAIKKAIEEYNGTITATIAAEIATVNGKIDALTQDIDDLKSRVSSLEDRVGTLENLINKLIAGVKWSVLGTVDDGAGNTWTATLVAWNDDTYTIKNWYNIDGYDFDFVINEDGTIGLTNGSTNEYGNPCAEAGDGMVSIYTGFYGDYAYSGFEGDKDAGKLWFSSYRTNGDYILSWPALIPQSVTVDELVGTYAQENTYQFYSNGAWGNYSSDNDITISKVDANTVSIVGFMYTAEDGGQTINATVDAENGILTIEPQLIDSWYKLAGQSAETDAVKVSYTGNGTLVFGKWCAWYNGYAWGYSTRTVLTKK